MLWLSTLVMANCGTSVAQSPISFTPDGQCLLLNDMPEHVMSERVGPEEALLQLVKVPGGLVQTEIVSQGAAQSLSLGSLLWYGSHVHVFPADSRRIVIVASERVHVTAAVADAQTGEIVDVCDQC